MPQSSTANKLDQRLSSVEARQQTTDERMNKYDQFISELRTNTAEIRDSTLKHDLLYTTFVEEMKELKQKDVDIGELLVAVNKRMDEQDKQVEKQKGYWSTFIGIGKWLAGLFGGAFLVYLGTVMTHLRLF